MHRKASWLFLPLFFYFSTWALQRQQLKALDLRGLDKRDVLITIYIAWVLRDHLQVFDLIAYLFRAIRDKKGKPRIWRKIRLSAGIGLSTFQDKVLAPVMGWYVLEYRCQIPRFDNSLRVRNLHSYTFTDFRDGSLFGPVVRIYATWELTTDWMCHRKVTPSTEFMLLKSATSSCRITSIYTLLRVYLIAVLTNKL
jgi:hypothetical protein